jgi:hypothetical protein
MMGESIFDFKRCPMVSNPSILGMRMSRMMRSGLDAPSAWSSDVVYHAVQQPLDIHFDLAP